MIKTTHPLRSLHSNHNYQEMADWVNSNLEPFREVSAAWIESNLEGLTPVDSAGWPRSDSTYRSWFKNRLLDAGVLHCRSADQPEDKEPTTCVLHVFPLYYQVPQPGNDELVGPSAPAKPSTEPPSTVARSKIFSTDATIQPVDIVAKRVAGKKPQEQ